MSFTFHRYIIVSILFLLPLSVYADNTSPARTGTEESNFLQNLNASGGTAPIGSSQNQKPTLSTNTTAMDNTAAISSPTAGNSTTPTTDNSQATKTGASTQQPTSSSVASNTTAQSSPEIQQLQATETQLQNILNMMQQQTKQLQTSLTASEQQLQQAQASAQKTQSPEDSQRLQQLRNQHQQIQATLTNMLQQQTQLQLQITTNNQLLKQLEQTSAKAAPTTPSTTAITTSQPEGTTADTSTKATTNVPTQVQSGNNTPVDNTTPSNQAPTTAAGTTAIPAKTAPNAIDTNNPANATSPATSIPSPPTNNNRIGLAPLPVTTTAATTEKNSKPAAINWTQDPAVLLRIGLAFIGIALLMMIFTFWPRSRRQKFAETSYAAKPGSNGKNNEEDLTSEYDFMSTEEAIPARLDLARGYIEMGNYEAAREAIEPVFEKGSSQQRKEAQQLLAQIDEAETSA